VNEWIFPVGLIVLAGVVLWIWALVDVIKVPDESMFQSGSRLIWVLVIVLAGFIGAIIYLVVGRPSQADRARKPAQSPVPPPPPGSIG
jgi:hypothetical protein